MLPTKNIIQTPTTRTAVIASTDSADGIGIVSAQPSAEQIETVDLLVTCTAQYASDIFPHPNLPCHHPIAIFDERGKPILHRCDVIANTHQHSTRLTQRIAAADNPIPARASQQMELLNYDQQIVNEDGELIGFMVTQTSSALYANNAPAHAPREVEVGLHNFQEICTLQDDNHHIHSITRPVFIPFAQTPIPPKAFGFCRHLTYDLTSIEQNPPRLSDDGSHTASSQGSLPSHWKDMNKNDKEYYLNDIVQCFEDGATCNIIAKRHNITAKNVQQILVEEAKKTLRTTREEREISLIYRSDRGNILELAELTRPPLRQFLEANFAPHRARLDPYKPEGRGSKSETSYSIVQKKLKTNAIDHATWCFPRYWDQVSSSNKDRYVDDICECYEKKATYSMIAKRHNIRVLAVRGILLLRYQKIRSPHDEKALVIRYTDLSTRSLPGVPILGDLPENLPPLQHHLTQLVEQTKSLQTGKAKPLAFAKSQRQATEAPVRQNSSSPNFAGSSRTATSPREAPSKDS